MLPHGGDQVMNETDSCLPVLHPGASASVAGSVAVFPQLLWAVLYLMVTYYQKLNAAMKKCTGLLSAALLTLITTPVAAVNKCVNDAGQVVYQTAPCPATTKGSELNLQSAAALGHVCC